MTDNCRLCLVLPCYNEEAVLENTITSLSSLLDSLVADKAIDCNYKIVCIDDGSEDGTWNIIQNKSYACKTVYGIKLSRNVGHQNALLAGLEYASRHYDAIITIDADLQDDISVIKTMIEKYHAGCDIVYGVRRNRNADSFFKQHTANFFYNIMKNSKTPVIPNHADFRMMSRRTVLLLLEYKERNVFLRGIVPTMGFKSDMVYYDRNPRTSGTSKYPFTKMVNFAIEGITSFSIRPIRMIFIAGVIFLFCTLSISVYVAISIILGRSYPGWASLMLSLWLIGSLVLIALGIIGEYIGKIYLEVKNRPRYFIERTTDDQKKD